MKVESVEYPQSISVDYVKNGQARLNCCTNVEEVQFVDEQGNECTKYIYDHACIKWALPNPTHITHDEYGAQQISDQGIQYLASIEEEILSFAGAML